MIVAESTPSQYSTMPTKFVISLTLINSFFILLLRACSILRNVLTSLPLLQIWANLGFNKVENIQEPHWSNKSEPFGVNFLTWLSRIFSVKDLIISFHWSTAFKVTLRSKKGVRQLFLFLPWFSTLNFFHFPQLISTTI